MNRWEILLNSLIWNYVIELCTKKIIFIFLLSTLSARPGFEILDLSNRKRDKRFSFTISHPPSSLKPRQDKVARAVLFLFSKKIFKIVEKTFSLLLWQHIPINLGINLCNENNKQHARLHLHRINFQFKFHSSPPQKNSAFQFKIIC